MGDERTRTAALRCHCGGVEIRAALPSRFVAHCYCQSCRTTHAAGVVTWIGFKRSQVEIVQGRELLTPVDRAPSVNVFADERPEWAPMNGLPHA